MNGNPAAIVAHEKVLAHMSQSSRPSTEWPLNTLFEDTRDFYFNGEAIFLYHFPSGHSDGDVFVYFRSSDVLVAGDLFVTTTYPVIDAKAGGGVDGFMAGLNKMLDIAVPKYLQEGGTYVIPGHGRVGDEADILEYRDFFLPDDQLPYDEAAFEKRLKKPAEAAGLLRKFRDRLAAATSFDTASLEKLMNDFVQAEGIQVGQIIHAVRVAVTGKGVGFGLFETLALLGKGHSVARIDRTLTRL